MYGAVSKKKVGRQKLDGARAAAVEWLFEEARWKRWKARAWQCAEFRPSGIVVGDQLPLLDGVAEGPVWEGLRIRIESAIESSTHRSARDLTLRNTLELPTYLPR